MATEYFGGSFIWRVCCNFSSGACAPVLGLILLDPASVHPVVTAAMDGLGFQQCSRIGFKKVRSRGRSQFRKRWAAEFAELSVLDSTHV